MRSGEQRRAILGMGTLSTAAVALAISTLGPPAAAVESSAEASKSEVATKTATEPATSRSRPAGGEATTRAARPARAAAHPTRDASGKRVWTMADLERLRASGTSRVSVIASPRLPELRFQRPLEVDQGLAQRFREVIAEADEQLRRLESERLAARNPFLRGTLRDSEGKPRPPRSIADIEAAIASWTRRKGAAEQRLAQMSRSTGTPVEELAPEKIVEPEEPEPRGPQRVSP